MSACLSVRMENLALTGQIFVKFNIEHPRKSVEKIQVSLKSDNSKGTSNEV
jgi:hypothetical protein